ncbi:MAG: MFS transporter [Candidatus Heimdallarchaeota archaeon]
MNIYGNSEEIERIKRKNLWAIFFINLIHGMGAGMFNVVFQPFILDLTNSILITGILVTIGMIVQFLPMPLVGRLSDGIGRRKVMLASLPFYIFGLIFLIFSNSSRSFLLVIGIVLYFLGAVMNNLSILNFISENSNKSKGLIYGLILFSFFGGTIIGSTFVLFGSAFDTRLFFFIFIELLLCEGIINLFFISEKSEHFIKARLEIKDTINTDDGLWKKIIKNPKSRGVLVFLTIDLFIYNIGLSVYIGGLRDFYSVTIDQLALITIVFNVANMIFQIPGGHLADRIGKKKSLIYSQFFGLSFFAINIIAFFMWTGGFTAFLLPAIILSHIPFAMSVCTFIPSEQMALTDLDEKRKAESYGIVGMIRGFGILPTGYIGGFLIENVHYITPLFLSFFGIFFEIWYLSKYFHD